MNFEKGEILYLDKPLHWTSFDLVNKIRYTICKHLQIKKLKVGHAGTLDPLATGVMIVCTGRATKLISELQAQTKEYIATLRLGATTPSFDLETEIDARYPNSHITRETTESVLQNFTGAIEQIPPAYSACKVNGDHAYKLARRGEEVHLKPKKLIIDKIELLTFSPDELKLRIVCSKGTYIRALARDVGLALNSGAHLTALVRTMVGEVRLEQCLNIDTFGAMLRSESLSSNQGSYL